MASHSRKPEKSLVLTKLPGYSSKQRQAKRVQHTSTHYTEPKATLKPNREVREITKAANKETTCNHARDATISHTHETLSTQRRVLTSTTLQRELLLPYNLQHAIRPKSLQTYPIWPCCFARRVSKTARHIIRRPRWRHRYRLRHICIWII